MSRKLGFWMFVGGIVGILISYIWWQSFYQQIAASPPTECLYQLRGPCRAISNVAGFLGAGSYEPLFFWASGVVAALGAILWIRGILEALIDLVLKR